jgi:hypothetical protein
VGNGLFELTAYKHPEQVLHRVRRANWLTLLSGNCVDQLGGVDSLSRAIEGGPARLLPLENGAVLIQACSEPRIGDLPNGDFLPEYRKVAHAIRPVRVEKMERTPTGSYDPWIQEWLEWFDKEVS